MRTGIITPSQFHKIIQIEAAVKRLEKKYIPKEKQQSIRPNEWYVFRPKGPNHPIYRATPAKPLINFMEKANINPNRHCVVLGSGLGLSTAVLSFYFKFITAYELNKYLHRDAEENCRNFGLNNIIFKNMNFLKVNMKLFGAVYFNLPFVENFIELMGAVLKRTLPGTIIISHLISLDFFGSSYFKELRGGNFSIDREFFMAKRTKMGH